MSSQAVAVQEAVQEASPSSEPPIAVVEEHGGRAVSLSPPSSPSTAVAKEASSEAPSAAPVVVIIEEHEAPSPAAAAEGAAPPLVKVEPTFKVFFEELLKHGPTMWLGLELAAEDIAALVPLLSAMSDAVRVLWLDGRTWPEAAAGVEGGDEDDEYNLDQDMASVVLAYIWPISTPKSDYAPQLFLVEDRKNSKATTSDHAMIGAYYCVMLLWTWFSRFFVGKWRREKMPYDQLSKAIRSYERRILIGLKAEGRLGKWLETLMARLRTATLRAYEKVKEEQIEEAPEVDDEEDYAPRKRLGAMDDDDDDDDGYWATAFLNKEQQEEEEEVTDAGSLWDGLEESFGSLDKELAASLTAKMDSHKLSEEEAELFVDERRSEWQPKTYELSLVVIKATRAMSKGWAGVHLAPLYKHGTLKNLSLCGCYIGDVGAVVVAELLKANCVMEVLDLRVNEIAKAGLAALGEALLENSRLSDLNLDCNDIDNDDAAEFLKKVLEAKNKFLEAGLQTLFLSDRSNPSYLPYAIVEKEGAELRVKLMKTLRSNKNSKLVKEEAPAALLLDEKVLDVVPEVAGGLAAFPQFALWMNSKIRKPPPTTIFTEKTKRGEGDSRKVNLEALKSYYERLQEAAAVNTTLKLLLVGLGTAGKTSMANRLRGVKCKETQEYCTAYETRTVGIDIASWRPENTVIDFKIWDFAGQDSYGLTHQFFLSEFSLNLLVVDVNRYAIGDDTKGKIDVVAYELQQHFGYDIREALPKIKAPILESDRIYSEVWKSLCALEATAVAELLAQPPLESYNGELLSPAEAVAKRVAEKPDLNLQPQTDVDDLFDKARKAQRKLKEALAPGSKWAKSETHGAASRANTPELFGDVLYCTDPGVKSKKRVEEKAMFKYKGRFERVRDLSRLALVCATVADLLKTVAYLRRTFGILELANRFAEPTALGWRDCQILLRVDLEEGTHHIAEIQVQIESFNVAREAAHEFYVQLRERLQEALEGVEHFVISDLERVQHFLLDRLTDSVSGEAVFDREVQHWIDILQTRVAAGTGAKFLLAASKIDLCEPEVAQKKTAAMLDRVHAAEAKRRNTIEREIELLDEDENVAHGTTTMAKRHRLLRKGGIKAAALAKAAKKRKAELKRLLMTRPKLLDEQVHPFSAHTGAGMDDLSSALVKYACREIFPFFGEDVPQADLDLADSLDKLRNNNTAHLRWKQYAAIAKDAGVREKHLSQVTDDLMSRGVLLHFGSTTTGLDKSLASMVFTDPQWLVDVLKQIVRHDLETLLDSDVERADFKRGVLSSETLRRLWAEHHGEDSTILDALEALMVQFELGVPMHEENEARHYMIPAYLPAEPTESTQIMWDAAGRISGSVSVAVRVEFPFGQPKGFFERCVVRLLKTLQTPKKKGEVVCWRSGLIRVGTSKGDPWLRFELSRDEGLGSYIDITSRASFDKPRDLVAARTAAWAINNTAKFCAGELLTEWPGAVYTIKVPCPSCVELELPNASVWAIEEFVHANSSECLHCPKCDQDIPIANLCPPLELVLKDMTRVRRIAAKWKGFQRHSLAHSNSNEATPNDTSAPAPAPVI